MFMSVHKGEGGVKIVPNPVHVVCERPHSVSYYYYFEKALPIEAVKQGRVKKNGFLYMPTCTTRYV